MAFLVLQNTLNKKEKALYKRAFGGERGIRTPGGLTLNSFQDCRNRPLCHLSGRKISIFFKLTHFIYVFRLNYSYFCIASLPVKNHL